MAKQIKTSKGRISKEVRKAQEASDKLLQSRVDRDCREVYLSVLANNGGITGDNALIDLTVHPSQRYIQMDVSQCNIPRGYGLAGRRNY